MILALEPEMRELVRLRDEVVALRFKANPPTPTLAPLIEGGPITLRQWPDGTWASDITVGPDCARTGVSGCPTDVDAYRQSVAHIAALLATEWTQDDDDA